jgi:hypothetical protein
MNLNFNPIDLLTTEAPRLYQLTNEYLSFISRYKNLFHYSLPVRIITPNENSSIYDKETDLTYNKYYSNLTGYKYDVYEYVPLFYTSATLFNLLIDNERGAELNTNLSVSILGFDDLTIGSFILFYDDNTFSNAVYEITNIRTPLLTNVSVPIFDVDLSLSDIDKNTLINNLLQSGALNQIYYFDYTQEKFITQEEYRQKVSNVQSIYTDYIPYFKNYFDLSKELYFCINSQTGEKGYEKYLNLYFLDYVGGFINKGNLRLDFYIPTGVFINPNDFTPDEDNYSELKYDSEFWDEKLSSLKEYSEQHARLYELHQIIKTLKT